MRILKLYAFFILMLCIASCASGPKTMATPAELAAFEKMVSNKSFQIDATWAQPMASQGLNSIANAGLLPPGSSASRIDITGTRGYLRVVGDSVMADLPYFGERQMGGGYNQRQSGIKFDGIPKDFSMEPAKNGTGHTLRFNISEDQESFQVVAQLFPSKSGTISIASTHRTTIWYQGTISEYQKEQ